MDFNQLVKVIESTHNVLFERAIKSVNVCLTLKNWLIGYRITEYEQNGHDRAVYGANLIDQLSAVLKKQSIPHCSPRRLYEYRLFYQSYPSILRSLPAEFKIHLNHVVTDDEILRSLPAELAAQQAKDIPRIPQATLLSRLSFTHFVELIKIEDVLKRSFYEIESVRGNWSARELKRQMGSLYYERSGLSKNKEKLAMFAHEDAHQLSPKDIIRDPYVFEFLGIKPHEVLRENNLRDSLLDKLQDFLLEMGKGFCFEARNKRILIGSELYFVDLVLYHRILKCHILLELKVEPFNHENVGQLNSYLSYYQKHEMTNGDNQPIGLLLCAEKNEALVEYALSGINNQLFVSKYQLALPDKDEIKNFLEDILRDVNLNALA
jgi:predicted nuclease of restriction endonuclease-like (RecB) superfamily